MTSSDASPRYDAKTASPDFAAMEREILEYWRKDKTFERSVESRPEGDAYVFYDGPPFANGLPHYGHLLTGYVKDAVARYQTMRGRKVERRFGWDCHGLPAELGAEKELGVSGRKNIIDYGIDKFNDRCRASVMQYAEQWKEYVTRQARWVDFDKGYKTMDLPYMESVIWAFKKLYDKGLAYESVRVMPYSWAAETPVSNFETRLDNSYRERPDKTVTALFRLTRAAQEKWAEQWKKSQSKKSTFNFWHENHSKILTETPIYIAAWTTTPWTLPSNLALAVNPEMEYNLHKYNGVFVAVASSPIVFARYMKELGQGYQEEPHPDDNERIGKANAFNKGSFGLKGSDLAGLAYEPLFPYFTGHENAFKIIAADFVTEESGTGIVHLAPGFGEDDFTVCKENGIAVVCPVDESGKFTAEVKDYEGMRVFDAIRPIVDYLKKEKKILGDPGQIVHNYPHCWRTDEPLIYKAVPSWYVEVSKFKDRMVELNQQINWIPDHIKDGQFGKWLENARDWSISRNRFWGTPIPVWKTESGKTKVFGSIKELEDFFGREVTDLHRPFIDSLVKTDEDGTWRRVADVFDCWFESGAMPFAQQHYPFDNKQKFEDNFPADFIVEYVAQTRGWFYTLMVLSTALFDRPPFLNCICHGVVLDENGQKLSKRLQNYADPLAVFDQYGADALRWVMLSSPIMQGGDLLIDKDCVMVRDAVRLAIKPLWNAFHFFALYANADGIEARFDPSSGDRMDRYILERCSYEAERMHGGMRGYDLPSACKHFEDFFEVLNNWYIRRSKERFWKGEKDGDKIAAYNTLYTVLHVMARAAAPLLPLLCESIWKGLGNTDSVHLQDFPEKIPLQDEHLSNKEKSYRIIDMNRVRDICNAALSIRNKEQIRVRQPLQTLYVVDPFAERLQGFADIIADELNVKEVVFSTDVAAYASHVLKIHFPVLGKRLPAKIKDIIAAVKKGEWVNENGQISIAGETLLEEEFTLLLQPKEPKGAAPLSTQDALVILDLTVTDELRQEGLMRDAIRLIQQSRKEADLPINARISLYLHSDAADMLSALMQYRSHIGEQTLADSVTIGECIPFVAQFSYAYEIEARKLSVGIRA
ncbi:MAG: isoleucine--tRNA ligase [Rickettsiales bacterium]